MGDRRFDALTRSAMRDWSRRGTVRLPVGGDFSGLLTARGAAPAEAVRFSCRHVCEPCRRSGQCCSSICLGPEGQ
jgi:hypothetical protein